MNSRNIGFRHAILVKIITDGTKSFFDCRISLTNLLSKLTNSHAKMRLKDLPDVHSRRNA